MPGNLGHIMRKASSPPALATLILLTAVSTMTLNMIVPSLATIAQDLKADYAVISLALGGYLAMTAVVQIGVGPLADRIGRRPVLLAALIVFAAASLGCAMARDERAFLAFRMLQAAVISAYVLSLAVVRDTTEGPGTARLLGKISMAMALAPMLGPMLGSALDTAFGWRAIFLFYAVAGAGLFCLVWFDLGETLPQKPQGSDLKPERVAALLREPLFWSYALCTAFSTGAFYVFLAGAPLIAASVFGISTAGLGVFIGSITGGFMTGSFLSSRLVAKHAPTSVMLLGRAVACVGMLLGLAIVAFGEVTPLLFFGCTMFIGVGNGLTTPNSNAGAISVRPRLAASAAGITGALTVSGGALITTATGFVLADSPSPRTLLAMMLLASFAGLLAALAAFRLENRKRA